MSESLPDTTIPEQLGRFLGIFSILPTILSVVLAFLLGDVIIALLIGLFVGELILVLMSGEHILASVWYVFPSTIGECVDVASNIDNVKVLVLCVLIGGLIGVLVNTQGFSCTARYINKRVKSPRGANILGQLFCTLFFFDDYANALISGPILQPITDKVGLSRERLAYIVDSTAAPVAGIAVVSSWVAVEMSVIDTGLEAAGLNVSSFDVFLRSIPYCFYCIFALLFILITSISGKEFGPMLEAERIARAKVNTTESSNTPETSVSHSEKLKILISLGSIVLMVLYLVISMLVSDGETITLLLQAAFFSTIVAIALCSATKLIHVSDSMKAWTDGVSNILPTIIVLVLAWSLASIIDKLGAVYYVVQLISSSISWQLVPAMIFICCCGVSFAAGSYGCMFMIMPMAIPIACAVMAGCPDTGDNFLVLCVASVLTGGIFGDHCSPMTDCTILAALGSGCDVLRHAYTQMPYAITVAITSIVCIILATLGFPSYLAIILGLLLLIVVVNIFGKHP